MSITLLAVLGRAYPRRGLRQRHMPSADLFCRERLNFDVAEFGQGEGFGPMTGVVAALAVPVPDPKVGRDGIAHGERPLLACGMVGAGNHAFAGFDEGLAIAQDRYAVAVAVVVGHTDGLELVGLVADIVPRDPLPGPAARLSVAEMKSRLYRAVIG